MEIVLMKTPIFKFSGNGMCVPGFVDITLPSVQGDRLLYIKFSGNLEKIRENLSNPINDFHLKCARKCSTPDLEDGFTDYEVIIELEDQSNVLKEIKDKMFANQFVRFEATVSILGLKDPKGIFGALSRYGDGDLLTFGPREMTVNQTTNNFCFKDHTGKIPTAISTFFHFEEGQYFANVTVSMTISKFDLDLTKSASNINQIIFTEELGSDTVIIPGNGGNPVKCHRSFLMANSPVFLAMFQTDMKEAKSCEIKIQEMNEDVVRAFLAYLYYRDESQPDLKFEIAFQLLTAGHKYQIPDLVNAMTAILSYKPIVWYNDVDFTVKQYLFAKNLDDEDDLKTKALLAMKKERSALQKCTTFRDLFKDNAELAMEMFEDMAGVQN